MKWHTFTILFLALALCGALYLAFRIWWTCPLAPPLDIEKFMALDPGYTKFWVLWAAGLLVYVTGAIAAPLWMIVLELRKK